MHDVSLKVAMRCGDLSASRAFYGDVLGLELVDAWEEGHGNGCIFAVGTGLIELNETGGRSNGRTTRTHPFDLQIKVADLDGWLARIEGRWDHDEPKVQPWGERTVRMHDPDGVLVTIYQPLR